MKRYFLLMLCVGLVLAVSGCSIEGKEPVVPTYNSPAAVPVPEATPTEEPLTTESIPIDAPDLEWPADFPSSMYQSIQIIENDSYYAYLGVVRGLPHNKRIFYLSVAYKDSEREQWQYQDGVKVIDSATIHPPEYVRITFGEEPNILWAFGENDEKLVELDLETQEILWQYEIDENSPPNEPAHIKS